MFDRVGVDIGILNLILNLDYSIGGLRLTHGGLIPLSAFCQASSGLVLGLYICELEIGDREIGDREIEVV